MPGSSIAAPLHLRSQLDRSGFGEYYSFLIAIFGVGAGWLSLALTVKSAGSEDDTTSSEELAAVLKRRCDKLGKCGGFSTFATATPTTYYYLTSAPAFSFLLNVAHATRAARAGTPGESTFRLPSLEGKGEAELRLSLRRFAEKATSAETKKDGPAQRQTEIVRVAVQALALFASTDKTNATITDAFEFIRAVPELDPAAVSPGLKNAVEGMLGALFAHNGMIFQKELIANSRGPALQTVCKGMAAKHKRLLTLKEAESKRTIDFGLASTQSAKAVGKTVKDYAEEELRENGAMQDRRRMGEMARKATTSKGASSTRLPRPPPPPGSPPNAEQGSAKRAKTNRHQDEAQRGTRTPTRKTRPSRSCNARTNTTAINKSFQRKRKQKTQQPSDKRPKQRKALGTTNTKRAQSRPQSKASKVQTPTHKGKGKGPNTAKDQSKQSTREEPAEAITEPEDDEDGDIIKFNSKDMRLEGKAAQDIMDKICDSAEQHWARNNISKLATALTMRIDKVPASEG